LCVTCSQTTVIAFYQLSGLEVFNTTTTCA